MDTYLKEIDDSIDDLKTEIKKLQAREFMLYLTLKGVIKTKNDHFSPEHAYPFSQ